MKTLVGSFINSQKENGLMGLSHKLIFYIEWLLCIKHNGNKKIPFQ
jgi:hypothetical protein